MKKLIIHGKYNHEGICRRGLVRHASIETALCGEHFDEIEVRLYEEIPFEPLMAWLADRGFTRLRPGGRIVIETCSRQTHDAAFASPPEGSP